LKALVSFAEFPDMPTKAGISSFLLAPGWNNDLFGTNQPS